MLELHCKSQAPLAVRLSDCQAATVCLRATYPQMHRFARSCADFATALSHPMGGVSTCFALLILCVSRVALKASNTWTIRISLGPVAAASGGVTHGGRGVPRAWLGGAATVGALLLASRGCGMSTRAMVPGGEYPVEDITLIPPG
jgi:hypothetical protein